MFRHLNIVFFALVLGYVVPASADTSKPSADKPVAAEKADAADEKKEDGKTGAADEKKEDGKGEASTGEEAKADGPAEVKTDEEAEDAVVGFYKALTDKNWALAISFGLTLLVFGARKAKLLDKVPAKSMPWVVAGVSIVGYVATALAVEGASIGPAILSGLGTGVGAVGLYELVLKGLVKKPA
jgi:hypothetical protein